MVTLHTHNTNQITSQLVSSCMLEWFSEWPCSGDRSRSLTTRVSDFSVHLISSTTETETHVVIFPKVPEHSAFQNASRLPIILGGYSDDDVVSCISDTPCCVEEASITQPVYWDGRIKENPDHFG